MDCAALVEMGDVVRQIGGSDCEDFESGFLVQPVNALTSLSYVVVAVALLAVAWRRRRLSLDAWVFAALLAAVGLGSVAFHGPQPTGARVMHDLPILLVVLYIVARDLELVTGGRRRRWSTWVPTAVAATVVTMISVDVGTALTGLGVLVVAGLEFVIFRRNLRGLDDLLRRRASMLVVGSSAVAGATWLLGRTDSPACDPDGVFQFHGLWHVLSALVFALWWLLAERPLGPDVVSEAPSSARASP